MGVAPVNEFLRAGLRLGLGTDSPAATDSTDMLTEMRLGMLVQRAVDVNEFLDSSTMLEMATMGGARALRLDDKIGSLDVGCLLYTSSASPGATARRSRHRAVPPPQSAPATGNMFARSTNGPWRNDSKAATTNPADVNSKVQALARTPMSVDPEGSTNEVHSTSIHHACQNPMPRSRNENGARSASPRPVAPWRCLLYTSHVPRRIRRALGEAGGL